MAGEPSRGAAYWLWEEEQQAERAIARITDDIEDLEKRIVEARTRRDELRLVVVEMRAARGIIEQSGLKVERVGTAVNVSIDPAFAAPSDAPEHVHEWVYFLDTDAIGGTNYRCSICGAIKHNDAP